MKMDQFCPFGQLHLRTVEKYEWNISAAMSLATYFKSNMTMADYRGQFIKLKP